MRELAHLFHGAEDGRLIDFGPAFTFESTYTFAVLPERHRRSVEHPIGDLHVRLALGIEHEDTADIARVTPDDEGRQAIACGNPGAEGMAVIPHVVEHEPVALNRAA